MQAHVVELEGQRWLADVGGADCTSLHPLQLSEQQLPGPVRLHSEELPPGNPGWALQVLALCPGCCGLLSGCACCPCAGRMRVHMLLKGWHWHARAHSCQPMLITAW